jgi:hypothetical protein
MALTKTCRQCGAPFQAFPSRPKAAFCSKPCLQAWNRAQATFVDVPCKHCGTMRRLRTCDAPKYRFCSRKCRTAWIAAETPKRFWSLVEKTGHPRGCWIYTGRLNVARNGYGYFDDRRRTTSAHRYAWQLTQGDIPHGLDVCHTCDNPPCVNPDHLFLGTQKDNAQDMKQKGRSTVGERSGTAKLTEVQVREIRALYVGRQRTKGHGRYSPISQAALARRFGVDRATIQFVVARKTWKHLS